MLTEKQARGESKRERKIEKVTSCRKLCDLKKKSTGGMKEHSPFQKLGFLQRKKMLFRGQVISSAPSPVKNVIFGEQEIKKVCIKHLSRPPHKQTQTHTHTR